MKLSGEYIRSIMLQARGFLQKSIFIVLHTSMGHKTEGYTDKVVSLLVHFKRMQCLLLFRVYIPCLPNGDEKTATISNLPYFCNPVDGKIILLFLVVVFSSHLSAKSIVFLSKCHQTFVGVDHEGLVLWPCTGYFIGVLKPPFVC